MAMWSGRSSARKPIAATIAGAVRWKTARASCRDIVAGIRKRCRPDFGLGIRLSPERFGLKLAEVREVAAALLQSGDLDYVDMSLWDVFKEPAETEFQGRSLMSYFTEIGRGRTRLGVAGKIVTGDDAQRVLDEGANSRSWDARAILHHDFPHQVERDPHFRPAALPVTVAHLAQEGLSPKFIAYMQSWKGFVAEEPVAAAT